MTVVTGNAGNGVQSSERAADTRARPGADRSVDTVDRLAAIDQNVDKRTIKV